MDAGTPRTTGKRRLNTFVILAAAVFAAIFLAFKWQSKFPYSGTWQQTGGSKQIQRISFDWKGACTVSAVDPGANQLVDVPCDYHMVNDRATIRYVVHKPGLNDRTEEQRFWFKGQLIPSEDGKVLTLSPLDGAMFHVEEGNVYGQQVAELGKKPSQFKKVG